MLPQGTVTGRDPTFVTLHSTYVYPNLRNITIFRKLDQNYHYHYSIRYTYPYPYLLYNYIVLLIFLIGTSKLQLIPKTPLLW